MEWAGIEVMPITPELAKRHGIRKGKSGVVVLEAEGMAAAAGIMRGDVIQGLNRKRVNNMADFMSATANANIMEGVLLDISRQGDPLFITM
jgi:S1-C subfamily serine protease